KGESNTTWSASIYDHVTDRGSGDTCFFVSIRARWRRRGYTCGMQWKGERRRKWSARGSSGGGRLAVEGGDFLLLMASKSGSKRHLFGEEFHFCPWFGETEKGSLAWMPPRGGDVGWQTQF